MASMDFYGFSFNGTHSSTLGILRVSNGNRYNDTILPAFQDKTVPVPGGDGTYFFDSFYTNRTFNLSIAFDNISETQFRKLRQVFSTKNMGPLIFDEAPYKVYTAKIQSPPQLNYICFDVEQNSGEATSTLIHNHNLGEQSAATTNSSNTTRVYKGEGTIQFICYNPYAKSRFKYLSACPSDITNKDEWKAASGMLNSAGSGPSAYDASDSTSIRLFNPGDLEADFMSYYALPTDSSTISILNTSIEVSSNRVGLLNFANIARQGTDVYMRVNSKTNLVEGCDASCNPTGTLYNAYIVSGDFFKIPIVSDTTIECNYISSVACASIDYNYLYY